MKPFNLDANLRSMLITGGAQGSFLLGSVLEECNAEACQIWGYPRQTLLGKSLSDLSPESQPDGASSAQQLEMRVQAARAGLPQTFEWRFQRGDGELIESLVALEAVEAEGRTCLLGRLRDVTYLNRAESALRESETRLQQILNNATAIVYVKDRDGRNLFVNRQFLRTFNLREADVIGRLDTELFPRDIAEALRKNDLQVLDSNTAIEFEETVSLPNDERTYISIKFPLFNTDGQTYAVCGISTDITERKRTEEALRNAALGMSSATGPEIFSHLVRYLAIALGVDFVYVGKLIPGSSRLKTLAISDRGEIVDNVEYDLAGTPCAQVVGRQFHYIPCNVLTAYPGDNMLKVMGFEGYAGYPLFDSAGQPLGLIAITDRKPLPDREVTEAMLKIFSVRAAAELERMQVDEARRISEASYRTIFEASEDALFVHDMDTGAIIDANPIACKRYGYSFEELRQLDIGQLSSGIHPYTLEEAAKHIQKAKSGAPQCVEWQRKNKDGSLHWDEVFLKRATIAGVDRILAFTREITERKEREEALRKSEDRLRATVEAALDCIISMDGDGNIIEFNPAAESCFGHSRTEVLGKSLAQVIIPERDREAHQRGLERYKQTGQGPFLGSRVEVVAMRADGSEFPAELAIDVAQGPEGEIFIGYLRDITERRQSEEERARLEAQLRQAQKMEAIGQLTGGVAHDFNNILTGVMGYVVLAQERSEQYDDAKLSKYLDGAQRSGQRARDLIQQMLTFSRGQHGDPRPLALAPLIGEAVKLLSSTFPSTVEFETRLDGRAPLVMLDPVQLEQILMNLCINARDAIDGVGRVQVSLRSTSHRKAVCTSCRKEVSGDFVELAVCDNGSGIAPEILDRIFEPFFSTKEVGRGSGMGLSTVHGILHEHGGHIIVDSLPQGGTAFRALFRPLAQQHDAPTDADDTDSPARPAAPLLTGSVLVVDDDEVAGDFMGDLLETWGLSVTVVKNSLQSRDVFAEDPDQFDFAVLDQTMPRMTGLELCRHLLAIRPDLPVILYTGYPQGLVDGQAEAAGVRAVIRKPVDTAELFELVRELLTG